MATIFMRTSAAETSGTSDVITRVLDALNHPMIEDEFLRFWVSDERWCLRRSREFARHSKSTNVVSCVDGCLIRIQRPINYGNHYYCRKACCAVNMVAVVDARGRFTYINCGFVGGPLCGLIHRFRGSLKKVVHDLDIGF
ncbi:hypothetical protein Aduo_008958 [Ancylostoma duodenale]